MGMWLLRGRVSSPSPLVPEDAGPVAAATQRAARGRRRNRNHLKGGEPPAEQFKMTKYFPNITAPRKHCCNCPWDVAQPEGGRQGGAGAGGAGREGAGPGLQHPKGRRAPLLPPRRAAPRGTGTSPAPGFSPGGAVPRRCWSAPRGLPPGCPQGARAKGEEQRSRAHGALCGTDSERQR